MHRSRSPTQAPAATASRWGAYVWVAPASALGLVAAATAALGGAQVQRVQGVLEVSGGALGRWAQRHSPFSALTLGHVVLGIHSAELARQQVHEHAHVRQFERWGAALLLAYPLASAWVWLRGRQAYRDNPFEREARWVEAQRRRAASQAHRRPPAGGAKR